MIIGFEKTTTKIYEVPFPAITICPEKKFYYQKSYSIEDLNKLEVKEREELGNVTVKDVIEAFLRVCPKVFYHSNHLRLFQNTTFAESSRTALKYNEIFTKYSTYQLAVFDARWKQGQGQFYTEFILTDAGFCITFNGLMESDIFKDNVDVVWTRPFGEKEKQIEYWNVEHGYTEDAKFTSYPLRLLKANPDFGYSLQFEDSIEKDDLSCNFDEQNFKIHVHHPADWPFVYGRYTQSFYNMKTIITVKPKVTKTSDDLSSYSPHV